MPNQDNQRSSVHCFVKICPNGCICLGFGPTMVHLERADFRGLLRAMEEAAERLGIDPRADEPSLGEVDFTN